MSETKAQFDEDAIVELTALIAFQNMSSKFNSALAVPPQGFCRLPGSAASEKGSEPKSPGPAASSFGRHGDRA
jgi:hypothetical protein